MIEVLKWTTHAPPTSENNHAYVASVGFTAMPHQSYISSKVKHHYAMVNRHRRLKPDWAVAGVTIYHSVPDGSGCSDRVESKLFETFDEAFLWAAAYLNKLRDITTLERTFGGIVRGDKVKEIGSGRSGPVLDIYRDPHHLEWVIFGDVETSGAHYLSTPGNIEFVTD